LVEAEGPIRLTETIQFSSQEDIPLIDPIDWDIAARSAYEISDDDAPVEFLDGNPRIQEQENRVQALLSSITNDESTFAELNDPWNRYRPSMKTAVDQIERNKKANLIADYFH